MTQQELVAQLRENASGVDKFVHDADKDSLRRLAIELDYMLHLTCRRMAREANYDFDSLKLSVYDDLADFLLSSFTGGTGEWDDETSIS